MEGHLLSRHYQQHLQQIPYQSTQGPHPHPIIRWVFFAAPLLYLIIVETKLITRVLAYRERYWVSTQSRNYHFLVLLGIFELILLCVGLYVAITDTWSTKEWVIWTALLVFLGLLILASSVSDPSLVLTALLAIACFFFGEWLYAETRDMNDDNWRHLIRNLLGFNAALLLFHALIHICQVLVYKLGLSQSSQANFFWIFGTILFIGFTLLNGLVFGPFIDVIGFIVGCLLSFLAASLFQTHEVKDRIHLTHHNAHH